MTPVYRYVDSYPVYGNQLPSNQNFHPSFEPLPTLVSDDPSKSVVVNQPWPYANSFGSSVPCYSYCNHGNFPGNYSCRPYPYFLSPQFHYCGHHYPSPDAFPMHYAPPPYYVRELPRYEYDKPNDYHCCGCPNHTHNQRNSGSVKIEEQEPDVEKKMGDSSLPSELKNYWYPVFWIPPHYMNNKEHKSLGSDIAGGDKFSPDMELSENVMSFDQDPRLRSNWFPVDVKNLPSMIQADNVSCTPDQKREDKMREFPFPVIWVPAYNNNNNKDETKEEHKEKNVASKFVEEPDSSNKFFTVKLPTTKSNDNMSRSEVVHEESGGHVNPDPKEKSSNLRTIPVKHMEAPKAKEKYEDAGRKERGASLKNGEDKGMAKASGASAKRQFSTSPKASKLPPVCLRVDPLPQKIGSIGSRSPSPPASKGQSRDAMEDSPEASVSSDIKAGNTQVQESTSSSSKEAEADKNKGNVIEVVQRKASEHKDEEQWRGHQSQFPMSSSVNSEIEASSNLTMKDKEKNEEKCIIKEDKGLNDQTTEQMNEQKETINKRKSGDGEPTAGKSKLSDEEAALRIQSAYRGFELRRWEPLKKLKQIAKIQDQVIEVRNKIYALESSSDLQKDERQGAVIGEMVMSLLLKLDTIQGLHPSIRDVRKSLARELVTLQEKLDLLGKAKPWGNPFVADTNNILGTEEGRIENEEEHSNVDLSHPMDTVSDTKETSNSLLIGKEEQNKSERVALSVAGDLESHLAETDKTGKGELHSTNMVSSELVKNVLLPLEDSGSEEISRVQAESICCDPNSETSEPYHVNEALNSDNNCQVSNPEKFLEGVTEEEPVASNKEQIERNIVGVRQREEVESNVSTRSALAAGLVELITGKETPEINLLEELPVEAIDEEEPEKHEQLEIQDDEVLPGGDVDYEATIDVLKRQSMESSNSRRMTVDISSLDEVVPGLNESKYLTEAVNEGQTVTEVSVPDKEVPNESTSKQECIEGFNDGVSVTESNDWVKIASQENDFSREKTLEGDVQETLSLKVNNVSERMEESSPLEEMSQVSSPLQKESHDVEKEVDQGIIDLNEDIILKEREHQKLETVSGVEREAVVGMQVNPVLAEHDEEKRVLLPVPWAARNEQEIEMGSERKLVEESEKMREMVGKLLEAGKEQLAVICSLTGRVKDLEKKLLRRKNMRRRRYRTATSPLSSATSSKVARKKAAAVAM